jgi:hypothetical protein
MRPGLLTRRRNKGLHRIFIVGTNLAEVTCLTELHIQHGAAASSLSPISERKGKYYMIVEDSLQNGHWVALLLVAVKTSRREFTQR